MSRLYAYAHRYLPDAGQTPAVVRSCTPARFAWLLLFCLIVTTVTATAAPELDAGERQPVADLRSLIDAEVLPVAGPQPDWLLLRAFYAGRDYRPVWIEGDRLRPHTGSAIDRLARAGEDGLIPGEYHVHEFGNYVETPGMAAAESLELLLTDGLLKYIRDLRMGRLDAQATDPEWHIRPAVIDPAGVLTDMLAAGGLRDALQQLVPRHSGYQRLRALLRAYRSLDSTGGWTFIPPGEKLERGSYDQRVHLLRHRLMLSGDLASYDYREAFQFDAALEAAVRDFQVRHGLEADGIVGRKTLAALNVPVSERIQQILLNMERWRWMPEELGDRYLLVNMAGFELQAVEDGENVLGMRVIIGRPYRSTPAFAGNMTYLVFNPYWNVPHKLAVLDLLPRQQEEPGYLEEKGFRVYVDWSREAEELEPSKIDWAAFTPQTFPYRLRQDPGKHNSLGRIKFMMPNRYAVYLHDTPSRHLFDRPVRTFSSGCIRVEDPVGLANFVLQDGQTSPGIDVLEEIGTGENHAVLLPERVPVYLLYLTAWVDDRGRAHFRDDIYGRDVLVLRAWLPGAG